jgi:hypothetical protein
MFLATYTDVISVGEVASRECSRVGKERAFGN